TLQGAATGTLHGRVTDPSGAVIIGAIISVKSANGQATVAKTDGSGIYTIKGLRPGKYNLSVAAPGFEVFMQDMDLAAGQNLRIDASLKIAALQQQLDVKEHPGIIDTDPTNNTGAIILKEKDLDRFSDDPDELEQQLRALAGVAAGGGSAQIYIDGFTSARLPPKSTIREIRINQDPFSAEYDQPGFGRIEVFTKPGGGQFHGIFSFRYNNAAFNSRSPFLSEPPV